LIGLVLSNSALGLYAAGLSFSHLPRFIAQGAAVVSFARIASRRLDSHAQAVRVMWRYTILGAVMTGLVTCTLFLLIPIILPLLFGAAFSPATQAAQILVLGSGIMSVRRLMAESAKGLGLPSLGSIGELVSWVIFLPAAILGARSNGIMGVAWAGTAAATGSLIVLTGALLVIGRGAGDPSQRTT
jgi:O-antigen/teichoic acid export membrane protein